MMYKTPTFAEPQQYNRPFFPGSISFHHSNRKLARKVVIKILLKNTEMLEKKYIYILHSNKKKKCINFLE
jgi:hypothetical protein